jgi:hypothetical protein
VSEPLSGTAEPFSDALVALRVVQVMTEDCPRPIDDGFAMAPAATGPLEAAVTFTVTWPQSALPDESVAVKR